MAVKKGRGLGKGLEALFGDVEVSIEEKTENKESKRKAGKADADRDTKEKTETAEGISYIDINDITPNLNQPRKVFDDEKLEELAASIKEHGLIQPIILRKSGRGYEIVAGERRWRAARKAGIKKLPCIVRELTDEENMLLAIIENMQREDLNPIEEAEGLNEMIKMYGLTQEEVSKSVGKSRPYITNCLRLLKLPEEIRRMITEGHLTAGHGRSLASVDDEKRQLELAGMIVDKGLSVREIEKLAGKGGKASKRARPREKNPNIKRVEEDLKEILGAKVSLNQKGRKGKLEIEYYSREDLERLIDLLKTLKQS